ncbi:hypothetical protein PR048_005365 [Dryococelus australis]|uniref:Uncharacterized protein n=1 Tax=Dryococelus australis TaxID=614101 RepID=A0ABQ9I819_9NEOP|nr:hypothetical protein PR048_005365 [Dryococelus australis]
MLDTRFGGSSAAENKCKPTCCEIMRCPLLALEKILAKKCLSRVMGPEPSAPLSWLGIINTPLLFWGKTGNFLVKRKIVKEKGIFSSKLVDFEGRKGNFEETDTLPYKIVPLQIFEVGKPSLPKLKLITTEDNVPNPTSVMYEVTHQFCVRVADLALIDFHFPRDTADKHAAEDGRSTFFDHSSGVEGDVGYVKPVLRKDCVCHECRWLHSLERLTHNRVSATSATALLTKMRCSCLKRSERTIFILLRREEKVHDNLSVSLSGVANSIGDYTGARGVATPPPLNFSVNKKGHHLICVVTYSIMTETQCTRCAVCSDKALGVRLSVARIAPCVITLNAQPSVVAAASMFNLGHPGVDSGVRCADRSIYALCNSGIIFISGEKCVKFVLRWVRRKMVFSGAGHSFIRSTLVVQADITSFWPFHHLERCSLSALHKLYELPYLPKEFLLTYIRYELLAVFKYLPIYLQLDKDIYDCMPCKKCFKGRTMSIPDSPHSWSWCESWPLNKMNGSADQVTTDLMQLITSGLRCSTSFTSTTCNEWLPAHESAECDGKKHRLIPDEEADTIPFVERTMAFHNLPCEVKTSSPDEYRKRQCLSIEPCESDMLMHAAERNVVVSFTIMVVRGDARRAWDDPEASRFAALAGWGRSSPVDRKPNSGAAVSQWLENPIVGPQKHQSLDHDDVHQSPVDHPPHNSSTADLALTVGSATFVSPMVGPLPTASPTSTALRICTAGRHLQSLALTLYSAMSVRLTDSSLLGSRMLLRFVPHLGQLHGTILCVGGSRQVGRGDDLASGAGQLRLQCHVEHGTGRSFWTIKLKLCWFVGDWIMCETAMLHATTITGLCVRVKITIFCDETVFNGAIVRLGICVTVHRTECINHLMYSRNLSIHDPRTKHTICAAAVNFSMRVSRQVMASHRHVRHVLVVIKFYQLAQEARTAHRWFQLRFCTSRSAISSTQACHVNQSLWILHQQDTQHVSYLMVWNIAIVPLQFMEALGQSVFRILACLVQEFPRISGAEGACVHFAIFIIGHCHLLEHIAALALEALQITVHPDTN